MWGHEVSDYLTNTVVDLRIDHGNPVYVRSVDSSGLVFSLSSHRHSYIGLVFTSLFIG